MQLKKIVALILVLSALGTGAGLATDKVGVGLYLANETPSSADAKLAPEHLRKRLEAVFGFKNYELLKSQQIELVSDWDQWFVPRKDLFIRLLPLHHAVGEQREVDYEIYQNGSVVASGRYEPHHDMPLFINGPEVHDGRLIFVFDAKW